MPGLRGCSGPINARAAFSRRLDPRLIELVAAIAGEMGSDKKTASSALDAIASVVARAVAVDVATRDFVDVARLRGESLPWIMAHEILPNPLPPLISEFGLRFCFNFLYVASLSFLGLGVQPPLADWGGMVKENKDGLIYGKSAALLPAGAIAALAISVNLVADWILTLSLIHI